jgi:type II secretory pathway pseudopilin PulG
MVRARGFTYLTVLFLVAMLSGGLALVGHAWHNASVREKEAELLFAGNQYRKAIQRYYEGTPGTPKRYPRRLEDLLRDERFPDMRRHLRRLYPDPVTSNSQWGIVKAPDGGILGVHSISEQPPLKTSGFKLRDRAFDGAQKHSDWKFVYLPPTKPPAR